jgi:hypothetical protein
MNSLLLLLILLALVVIFLFSINKNEHFGTGAATTQAPGGDAATTQASGGDAATTQAPGGDAATTQAPGGDAATTQAPGGDAAAATNSDNKFYPVNRNLVFDNCESITYVDCLLDNSDHCKENTVEKTINGCKTSPLKIHTDMIYGNEYLFIDKPFYIDDVTGEEVNLSEGLILVRFTKTLDTVTNWFKVGIINDFGYTLHKLYSELDSSNLPIKTNITWKHNEPIVFIHRQKIKRLSLMNIELDSNVLYYTINDEKLLFINTSKDTPLEVDEVRTLNLSGETIVLENLDDSEISNLYTEANLDTLDVSVYNLLKTRSVLNYANVVQINNDSPQMNKLNSKTFYFNGDKGWKQTYNPSDTYIDKNITLLSKLYINNNEIKNLEQEIDKLIEKINL